MIIIDKVAVYTSRWLFAGSLVLQVYLTVLKLPSS